MDCHSTTSSTHAYRENEILFNSPAEDCLPILEVVSVCCVLGVGRGVVGAETVLHSAAQASRLETHYIANNGFFFNFPSARIVDMSYLTLKCVFTAGGSFPAEHVTSRCGISGLIPSIGKKVKKLNNNKNPKPSS